MAHIHTLPGQIDNTAGVFIVDTKTQTVLLRMHEKYKSWLAVGGHIELDETPEQAALREVKEEVGLEIEIWRDYARGENFPNSHVKECLPPYHMNIHPIGEDHRHLDYIYYAKALSTDVVEGDDEKSGGIQWWNKNDLESSNELDADIKWYALDALAQLCK